MSEDIAESGADANADAEDCLSIRYMNSNPICDGINNLRDILSHSNNLVVNWID